MKKLVLVGVVIALALSPALVLAQPTGGGYHGRRHNRRRHDQQ